MYRPIRSADVFLVGLFTVALLFGTSAALSAETQKRSARHKQDADTNPRVSPVLGIRRDKRSKSRDRRSSRPFDGSRNNLSDSEMNAAHTALRRLLPNDYLDGVDSIAGQTRPWPRTVSNIVLAQSGSRPNTFGATDFVWQWGQFIDHDITLSDGTDPPESHPIVIPDDDPVFPVGTGIDFNRSIYLHDGNGVRQQINEISGWIDASMVYGSDNERAVALRTMDGTGRLKVEPGNLLPRNLDGLANAGGPSPHLFLAGDVRSNEQAGLAAMHTLFVREHNRLANLFLSEANGRDSAKDRRGSRSGKMYRYEDESGNVVYSDRPPAGQTRVVARERDKHAGRKSKVSGDQIYERARAIVVAEIQHITYHEFLPVLLGPRAVGRYSGYRPGTDARVANEFSTAAFRIGHSMLSPTLLRLDADGEVIAAGNLALRDAFFAPQILRRDGIEPLLRGLAGQLCQQVDAYVIDDVRNFLFGDPGLGGLDLAALNIQRGRDHGNPDYNSARIALGLAPVTRFADVSGNPETVSRLRRTYRDVNDIDLWVGGVAEDPYAGGMLGELFHKIVKRQFLALRDGDRFWYAKALSREDRELVESLTLADIIRMNTEINREIQDNVFMVAAARGGRRRP
ncbi:MAG: DUF4124 domain-containing protein [Gammaproteobacteria bacterium]|nr:DUF4124 domain-containing protein [Gammaproteobacteria bacterium]NNF49675.1 DUF4124 domain-containing protein [Woeseiaceae bacterium]MBT8093717.1 DUF4124 domain-containing protein [Gammaproteobacteria bacterium]MBT8105623.1 DUF4124 domain-containing protein [Gammaproteobacteria bacterium]NNK25637.1 DUF4124 domain-containing protein [Woeseiaceae bacterium]